MVKELGLKASSVHQYFAFSPKELAMQKLEAAILSDGHLNQSCRNVSFRLSLSDNKRNLVQRELIPIEHLLEFTRIFVAEVLRPLGVEPNTGYPKIYNRIGKDKEGKFIPGVMLETHVSRFLTELYHKYYPNGKKAIPEDFIITDVFLAWHFMLDGCSQWHGYGGPGVVVNLCTHGFDLHSIELFESQLYSLGVNTSRSHKRVEDGAGIMIAISWDSTDQFMSIVDPFVISPYRYKIKYRGSCPTILAAKYKEQRKRKKEEKQQAILKSSFDALRQKIKR